MRTATAAAAIAIAAVTGYALARTRPAPPGPPPTTAPAAVDPRRDLDQQALRALIRATIRDQLRTTPAAVGPAVDVDRAASAPTPAPVETIEPTPAQREARRDVESLVADAITGGRWSDAERDRFVALAAALPDDERAEALRPLIIAINDQRVDLDVDGPAF